MDNFNMVVSTGKNFETQAKAELWFNLLSIGDENPIIFSSNISGLVLAYTNKNPRDLIYFLRDVMENKDPNYTQNIHKIYPVDRVVLTEIDLIKEATLDLVKTHPYCKPNTEFRISIRKRNTDLETKEIIAVIADNLDFPVNLKKFDWNIQIEIIGNYTGIGILRESDIFRPNSKKI